MNKNLNWKSSIFNEYLGQLDKDAWVVYNNLSGAMLALNHDLYQSLFSGKLNNSLKPGHVKPLNNRGIIVQKEVDEINILKSRREIHIHDVTSIGLQILPTLYCNFSCHYCYEQPQDNYTVMSKELMDKIIAHIKRTIRPTTRYFSVMWFGGEPLLAMDCIKYLSNCFLEICKMHSIEYNSAITTNGYMLNKYNSKILLDSNVTTYQITLDGPAYIHDQRRVLKNGGKTWKTIVNNLKNVTGNGLNVTVRMNIDKSNVHSVEELVEELDKHGIKKQVRISLGVVSNHGKSCRGMEDTLLTTSDIDEIVKQRNLEDLLLKSKDRKVRRLKPDFIGCVATARNSVIVGPEGELYKCPKVVGLQEETCGSLFQYDDRHKNFRKWESCDNLNLEACRRCSMVPVCDGFGCSYDFTIQNKNIFECNQELLHKN